MDVAEEVYTSYAALVVLPDSPTVDCYKSYRLVSHISTQCVHVRNYTMCMSMDVRAKDWKWQATAGN